MPKVWDDVAERDLVLAIHMANNKDGGSVRVNWSRTRELMIGLGYTFTESAITQRWSKVNKEMKTRRDAMMNGNSPGVAGAAAPSTSRKRKAPSSSGAVPARASAGSSNQLTRQMAANAYAADQGGDDEEPGLDVKPPVAKRAKTNGSIVGDLAGLSIDLTEESQDRDDAIEVVQVVKKTGGNKPPLKRSSGKTFGQKVLSMKASHQPVFVKKDVSIPYVKAEKVKTDVNNYLGGRIGPTRSDLDDDIDRQRERSVTLGFLPENRDEELLAAARNNPDENGI